VSLSLSRPRSTSSLSLSRLPGRAVLCTATRKPAPPPSKARKGAASPSPSTVSYGSSWFERTRDPYEGRTVAQEIARRRAANWEANGRKRDREDLYTAASGGSWEGSEYVGSANNLLTWVLVAAVAAPVAGLIFAWRTYGVLWG